MRLYWQISALSAQCGLCLPSLVTNDYLGTVDINDSSLLKHLFKPQIIKVFNSLKGYSFTSTPAMGDQNERSPTTRSGSLFLEAVSRKNNIALQLPAPEGSRSSLFNYEDDSTKSTEQNNVCSRCKQIDFGKMLQIDPNNLIKARKQGSRTDIYKLRASAANSIIFLRG
jgi:hypothetical protein